MSGQVSQIIISLWRLLIPENKSNIKSFCSFSSSTSQRKSLVMVAWDVLYRAFDSHTGFDKVNISRVE